MSIVQSVMAVIVVAIAGVSVAYPILKNTTDGSTATGTDRTLLQNLPTIFLLGIFVTIASSTV